MPVGRGTIVTIDDIAGAFLVSGYKSYCFEHPWRMLMLERGIYFVYFQRNDTKAQGPAAIVKRLTSKKAVTAREVAGRAGVSISAVSRVFTAGASVAPATREKILKASNALGYKPNVIARSLMTGRTELIGLVSNNFDNPAFMQIFDLFTRNLQDNGLRPLMVNLSGSVDSHEAVGMLRQYNVDGVIIASSTVSPDFLKGCLDARIPLVHAFGRSVRNAPYPIVAADNAQGGRLAAQALIDHGYRRLSVLGGPETASSTRARLKGFRETLAEAGIAILEERFADRYSHDEGYRIMTELLRSEKAEAVFCGDDILAMGAVDACTAAGMSIPHDLGILGFNDISMAAWSSYNLSTIRQPIAEIIVDAVQLMLSMINGEKVGPQNLRKCELVLRGSIQKIDGRPISSVPG